MAAVAFAILISTFTSGAERARAPRRLRLHGVRRRLDRRAARRRAHRLAVAGTGSSWSTCRSASRCFVLAPRLLPPTRRRAARRRRRHRGRAIVSAPGDRGLRHRRAPRPRLDRPGDARAARLGRRAHRRVHRPRAPHGRPARAVRLFRSRLVHRGQRRSRCWWSPGCSAGSSSAPCTCRRCSGSPPCRRASRSCRRRWRSASSRSASRPGSPLTIGPSGGRSCRPAGSAAPACCSPAPRPTAPTSSTYCPSQLLIGVGIGMAFMPIFMILTSDVAPELSGARVGRPADGAAVRRRDRAGDADGDRGQPRRTLGQPSDSPAALLAGYHGAFLVGAISLFLAALGAAVLLPASKGAPVAPEPQETPV